MRRPPTRVELNAEDISEYDQILMERKEAAASTQIQPPKIDPKRVPSSPSKRKLSVAERIGVRNK